MTSYVLRRLGLFIVTLFLTSVAVFAIIRILPGDAAQIMGGVNASAEHVEEIRRSYGLDAPLHEQYFAWISGLFHWDLGNSLVTGRPIAAELSQKFLVTVPLCALAMTFSLIVAIPLGIVAGLRHNRFIGRAISFISQLLAAVPVLWAGLLLIMVFADGVGLFGIFPSQGFPGRAWANPGQALRSLILPAMTIAIVEGAVVLRFVRSAVLEALPADYVRTAAAKGWTRTGALLRFGLPNVSLSVLSVVALQAASMITGAVVVETLFALPGIGSMMVRDVATRDLMKVQNEVLLLVALVLVIGLVLDVIQRLIDPRLRTRTVDA